VLPDCIIGMTARTLCSIGITTAKYAMKTTGESAIKSLIACALLWSLPATLQAWEPGAQDLDAAIATGGFAGYLASVTEWLRQKAPAGEPARATEAVLANLLKDPIFANTLDQRHLMARTGPNPLAAFAKADPAHGAFLAWLLRNTEAMDLYLEAAVPLGLADREEDTYTLSVGALEIWKRIYHADPDARAGLPLRLAIATALRPPGTGAPGAGQQKPPSDPVVRYRYFKTAHKNGELFPSFDKLTAWEYQFVVSSGASDSDLTWAREMINTWRPDLRVNEQVVNSTSEVWRRNSPHPYTDYRSVLSGGGKCGPRSSWSVMICQAFGIPAIGVGQPAHACVAYKAADPRLEPQPGSAWKVAYGRGWQVSKLEGLAGPDFLAGVEERSRAAEFSQVEHLRWLASALESTEQAAAIMEVAHKLQRSAQAVKTDLTASAKADEADAEVPPAKAAPAPASAAKEPLRLGSAATRIEAAEHSRMSGVRVYDCFTGGRQVNFEKNVDGSWVEYTLEVPATGNYEAALRAATPNDDQVLYVSCEGTRLATVQVPNTTGLWETTPAANIRLEKGTQTVRISAPYQRGIAVRWLELRLK
jgi:hypothetical protein